MKPIVSIIIPVFNQNERYFMDCVQSALAQSYGNIEIIISDNHSTNGVPQIISEFADERIKKYKPPSFLNMLDHFAYAAACANKNSKYLSFLSSDDLLAPNAISELVKFAETHPNASFITGNTINAIDPPRDFNQAEFKVRNAHHKIGLYSHEDAIGLFCPWGIASVWMVGDLIRHDAYTAIGGISKCDYYISGDLWLTVELLKLENSHFGCIQQTTGFFRQRPKGVLPADGVRGISIDLDMLRYCNAMLRFARERRVSLRSIFSIQFFKIKTLLKAIILILASRSSHSDSANEHLRRFADYSKVDGSFVEKKSLAWALTIEGYSFTVAAYFSRKLIEVVRKT